MSKKTARELDREIARILGEDEDDDEDSFDASADLYAPYRSPPQDTSFMPTLYWNTQDPVKPGWRLRYRTGRHDSLRRPIENEMPIKGRGNATFKEIVLALKPKKKKHGMRPDSSLKIIRPNGSESILYIKDWLSGF